MNNTQKRTLESVDIQYFNLLETIKSEGSVKGDRTGTGTTSIFGHYMKIDLTQGFPLLTSKQMSLKNISTELLLFMRGQTSLRILLLDKNYIWVGDAYKKYTQYVLKHEELGHHELINSIMRKNDDNTFSLFTKQEFVQQILTNDKFNEMFGELGPIYGKQWRDFNGVDQLQQIVDTLISNPDSRRMVVSAWNPSEIKYAILPPCHILFQFYSREMTYDERYKWCINDIDAPYYVDSRTALTEEFMDSINVPKRTLSLQFIKRSTDAPLGLPYNIASYAALVHIIAKMTNHAVDTLSCALGDVHIYNNQFEGVEKQLTQQIHSLPTLGFDANIKWSSKLDDVLPQLTHNSFILENYKHSPKVEYPLSN